MLINEILNILKQKNLSSNLKQSHIEKILNDNNVKVNNVTNEETRRSILHFVATPDELKILLNLNKDNEKWQCYFDAAGKSPLFYNADNIALIKSFASHGFNFKKINSYTGKNILFEANSLEAIKYYIQNGINPSEEDLTGTDPLMDAINKKNYQKVNNLFTACVTSQIVLNVTEDHIIAFNKSLFDMYKSLNRGIENTFVTACNLLYANNFIYDEVVLKMMFYRFKKTYLESKQNRSNRPKVNPLQFEMLLDIYLKHSVKKNMLDVIMFLEKNVILFDRYINKLSVEFINHILNIRIFRQITVAENETCIQHILLFEALNFGCTFTLDKLLSDIPAERLNNITTNSSMLFLCPNQESLMYLLKKGLLDPRELYVKNKFNMLSFAIENNFSYELTLEIAKKSGNIVESRDLNNIKLINKFITATNQNLKKRTATKKYLFLLIDLINLGAYAEINTFDEALNDVQDINIFLILQQRFIWSSAYENWKIYKQNNIVNMGYLRTIINKDKLNVSECLNNAVLVAMLSNKLPSVFYVNMFKKIDCPKNQNIVFFMLAIYDIINEEQIKEILPLITEPLTMVSLDEHINNYTTNITIMKANKVLESFNLASLLKFKYSASLMHTITNDLIVDINQKLYMFSDADKKVKSCEIHRYIVSTCSPVQRDCYLDNSIGGLTLKDLDFSDILCQINESVINTVTKVSEIDRINYFLSP